MMNFFKSAFCLLAALFINAGLFAQNFSMETIRYNGSPDKMVNLVIMGDGYTKDQQGKYLDDVKKNFEAMFFQSPWKEYEKKINIYAIKVISNVSGAADQPSTPIDNYFGSSFNTANIQRLLYPTRLDKVIGVLNSNAPFFDIGVIIVNDERYGGAGGAFATFSTNAEALEIMVHELGHTFARLSDEYWAGSQYARETENMTQNNSPLTVRWKNFLNINGVGIYPHSEAPNWFRPHQDCKMRFLGRDFCPVCKNELIKNIENLTVPDILYRPVAFFGASKLEVYEGDEVNFYDLSTQSPEEWAWSFEGGNPQISSDQNPKITYPEEGIWKVSLSVANSVGSSAITKTQYIQVRKDTEAPILKVKDLTIYLNESGKAQISINEIDEGTFDNVAIQKLSLSKTEFDCTNLGPNQVIFSAIDTKGNLATKPVTITVIDPYSPFVKVKDFVLKLDAEGKATLLPEDINDGSYDNCGIQSMALSKSTFGTTDGGDNEVKLIVKDFQGNENSKTAIVKVDVILSAIEKDKKSIKLYPNPSQGIIQIVYQEKIDPELKQIEIIDAKGSILKSFDKFNFSGNAITLDVTDLSNGVYQVRLISRDNLQIIKFIMNK